MLLLGCGALHAQVSSAILSETVADPSSAVISGATITASHNGTGFTRKALTDSRGEYKIEGLAPGSYTVARRFLIRDHGAMEFRASSFNAFNHPNWGIPGPNPDFGPFFGKIFTSGEPRRIQFALRYDF